MPTHPNKCRNCSGHYIDCMRCWASPNPEETTMTTTATSKPLRDAADAIRDSKHVRTPEQAARFLEGRADVDEYLNDQDRAEDARYEAILDQTDSLCDCDARRAHDNTWHADDCPTGPLRAALAAAGIDESCRG